MAINNSVTVDIKARADQASFKEVRKLFEQTIGDLETQKSTAMKMPGGGRAKEIKEEIDMVKKLQQAYENAYNHNYNNVNATQLSKNIKNMGVDVQKTGQIFRNLGVEGDRAFKTITSSVVSSNTQLQKTHTIFQDMMKTMGNTIKWGISSSLMNSFTGAVSEAYGYVKNLDKSLNDIRIVGEKSAKEMEQFAIHANKAAQALGSNTLDYTNASLIYYQQGLGDEQVKQMTDITVKMSNVLGTSAEEVSNYMTAIWNNFDDGSKSLEYYADVLTKLGAATASSAEEISTGLEKFAAIADATGLSYEYATAALTTVTAKTRQSAEVVGTAFKTLFARIQDLELGNTLDDGTTLGKYSEALYKVGINIKDSNGEMKKMDTILSEMGEKWSKLGNDEKVALAQTVAGVRQYNQLMALMENWDYFQENLDTARNATGTLVDQQAIYMESTEAHLASAEAAWEDFKDSLLDESIINFFADLSKVVAGFGSHILDSFGGGLPTLGLLGGIALKSSSATLGKTIYDSVGNRSKSRGGDQERQARDDERQMQKMFLDANLSEDQQSGLSAQYIANRKKEIETLNQYSQYMNEEQEETYKNILKEKMAQEAVVDAWDQKIAKVKEYFTEVGTGANKDLEGLTATDDIVEQQNAISALIPAAAEAQAALKPIREELEKITLFQESDLVPSHYMENIFGESTTMSMKNATAALEAPQAKGQELTSFWESSKKDNASLANIDRASVQEVENSIAAIGELDKAFKEAQKNGDKVFSEKIVIEYNKEVKKLHKNMVNALDDIETDAKEVVDTLSTADGASKADKARQSVDKLDAELKDMNTDLKDISKYDAFVNISGGALQAVSGVGALINTFSILEDESLSSGEKMMQIFTGVLMSAMSLASGVKSIGDSLKGLGVSLNLKDIHIPNFQEIGEGVQQFKDKTIALAEAKKKAELASKAAATGEQTLQTAQAATTATTTALAAGEAAVAGGTTAAGGAAAAATGPTMAFSTALWTILWPILLIVAAIAVLAVGIYAVVKAWNADADAAKAANERLADATEAYENCKKAAEEFKQTVEEYNTAKDAVKELTSEMEGFEAAVEAANEKARDLIETHGLYDDWSYDKDGVIQIDPDKLKEIQEGKDQATRKTYSNKLGAQIIANEANLKSEATNLGRDQNADMNYSYYHDGEDMKAVAGIINTLVDEEGNLIDINSSLEDQLKEQILASDDLSQAIKSDVDAFIKDIDVLEDFAESMRKAEEANKYYADQILSNTVQEQFSGYFDAFEKIDEDGNVRDDKTANQLESTLGAIAARNDNGNVQAELEKIDVSDVTSTGDLQKYDAYKDVENDEDLARAYARDILGMTEEEVNNLNYDGGWGKGTLKSDDGTKVLDGKNDEQMRQALAAKAEREAIEEKYASESEAENKKIAESLAFVAAGADLAGERYGADFTSAILTEIQNGPDDKIDLSSTFSALTQGEKDELANLSNDDLLKMFNLNEDDLKNLGYKSSEDFAKAFKAGLEDYEFNIDEQVAHGIGQLEDIEDLDSEDLTDYTKHLMEASDESDKLADSLGDDAETAAEVAKATMKMNKGIEDLAENSEDWVSILKKSGKESQEYAKALKGMKTSLSDILGVEEDFIDSDFVTENLEDIEKAATGDEAAIERLQTALSKDLICQVMAVDNFDELDADIQTLADKVASLSNDASIEIGAKLETGDFLTNANKLIEESGMTVEQAQAYFNSLGYEPEFETETKTVKRSIPQTTTHTDYKITQGYVDIAGAKVPIPTIDRTETSWIDGYKEVDETLQVPKIGNGIKSLKKISSPSANNYSSSNKGGKSLGKGGGGKPSVKDPNKDKKDPYQKVNAKLKTISNSLAEVSKEQEKLVGADLINNLAKQYELLNQEIETTAEKLEIANSEQARLQSELSAFGITFDKDGNIANYADIYVQQQNELNAVYEKYNSMSKDAQENYEATLKAAEEKWENFKTAISDYDTLVGDTIPGIESAITDAAYKQIELKLQAFHQEIEIRLNMAEAERDWNAFYNKVIKDIDDEDILGNAEARLEDFMSYYKDNMEGIIQVNTQHIQDILTDLKTMDEGGIAKFYGENGINDRAEALDNLKTYYEQLMSDLENIHNLQDEIHESYIDMMGEAQEKFDEQVATFETINNLLEHDKNIISMIYGEEAYSTLSQFYDKQEENYNKQLDFQKQQIEFWKMQMATAEEGSDAWNAAKENWISAVDAWNSSIEIAIQNLQDKYLNAINAIFQNLNNNVTDGMGLGYIETEWDLINQNADQYLDTVNAIYKVQELQNKYLDAIEKSSSPTQQKKLNDLMQQETDYLREQDKLSEYDLERANLKYEIALKQMALEDAQQNKSKLRLRRDSQGNYTYQYTQDEDQIASIQSEIADLYNQLYNLDADAYKGNLEEIFSIWQEFQERMSEAAQINDPEQRAAKELLIKEQYSDLINGLVEKNENLQANMYQSTMSHLFDLYNQNTTNYNDMSEEQKAILDQFINTETDLSNAAFDNLFDLYNINIESFKNMTDEQQDTLMNSMVPQWNTGVQQMIDKIAAEGGFLPTCKDAFEELDQATEDYMTGIEELQKQADVNFDDIKNGIDEAITATEDLLADNNELIDSYGKEIEAIKGVLEQLDGLIAKYEEASNAAKKATEDAKNYWLAEQNKNADVDNNIENIATEKENNEPAPVAETPKPTENKPAAPSLNYGSYIDVKPGTRWYANSNGGGGSGPAQSGTISIINSNSHGYHIIGSQYGSGWIKKSDIVGYDTGGYTGEWNNNKGRLALLHQKELVLNAHDTDNMLSAITILRDLTTNLSATLLNKMASITSGSVNGIGQRVETTGLEQSVVINAEFPNATSSKEIEDALNNLVNRASQHITK